MHTATQQNRSISVPGRPLLGGARALASLALSVAGGIHLAQALRHLPEASPHSRLHAAFFLAASLFQIVAAVALVGQRARRIPPVVSTANIGLAAVWAIAVTVGLPPWLAPAAPEPVTLLGGVTAGLEVLVAFVVVRSRLRGEDERTPGRWGAVRARAPLAATGVALVTAASVLPVSAQGHRHHATADVGHDSPDHGAAHIEGVHLHGLGGDAFDPGPDPMRQARGALAGLRLPAGLRPAAVAVDRDTVWVADREAGVVHRLDATSGRPLGEPTVVGLHPAGVALGAGSVWVTNAGSDSVNRLDRATGENVGTIPVGSVPVGVAVGAGSVWVTNSAEGTVSRIDPTTEEVTTTPRIGYGPTAVTVAAGRPWVVTSLDRAVVSLDPANTTVVTQTPVGAGPASIAFGHGSLWVASSSAGTVTRIDPTSGAQLGAPIVVDRRAQPGQGPAALAVGDRVWVLNNHDKTVLAIDPSTHALSQPDFIARDVARHITPASLALSDAGELWATEHDSGLVVRLQTRKDSR